MARVSKKNKCVHPYSSINTWYEDHDQLFTWCKKCKKVIDWHMQAMKSRRIPYWWSDAARELAVKLTGFKEQQSPDTQIDLSNDQSRFNWVSSPANISGQTITISNSTNYNGTYTIKAIGTKK